MLDLELEFIVRFRLGKTDRLVNSFLTKVYSGFHNHVQTAIKMLTKEIHHSNLQAKIHFFRR